MKIIYILWLRQLKRYIRNRSRMIGSLGQPLLFLFGLGYGFGPIFQKAGQGNYLQFIIPGIMCMSILFTSVFSGIEIIWDRQFGFLKETLVAPVSRFEIMIGKTVGGATVAFLQGVIIFALSFFFGFRVPSILSFFATLLLMFLIALLFSALGTAIASVLEDFQGFQLIINFLIMPIFFISGALFPLQQTPPLFQLISRFDPLSYGVDALRSVLMNQSHFGLSVDVAVLSVTTLIILSIGSYLFSKVQI